ncbi:MAG: UDP-N-acetylmuramate dehydrogenase [Alphaproteobacteria bacterium]|nr:UDP-N-acetylmuramate dehydrogenase [Alphaproteobacteria bacterium]
MMAAEVRQPAPSLLERLPPVRGRYRACVAISELAWFRVGGPAEIVFRPADRDDLADFLRRKPKDVPALAIGVGSNLLVRDGGIAGVVVRLGRGISEVTLKDDGLHVGAGALDGNVALTAQQLRLGGLEFLSGIPGTIGGGLRMNAGAYGTEFKDVLLRAEAVDGAGRVHSVPAADLRMTYRHCGAPADWIFTGCVLRAEKGDPTAIAARTREIREKREATQPVRARTGGSTFKNPPGNSAWKLIEGIGGRGLARGGARVSEQHCNFLINEGGATADDIEGLGNDLVEHVRGATGITLEWEIQRIGALAGRGPDCSSLGAGAAS